MLFAYSVFAVVAVILLIKSVVVVPPDSVYVVERLGKNRGSFGPGIVLLAPFVDSVRFRHRTTEQTVDLESQAVTDDNVPVRVTGTVRWKIVDAAAASYAVADVGSAMRDLALATVRKEIGRGKLGEVLTERRALEQRTVKAMASPCAEWGTEVAGCEVRSIEPPADVVEKIARDAAAERAARAKRG